MPPRSPDDNRALSLEARPPDCATCRSDYWEIGAFRYRCLGCDAYSSAEHPALVAEREECADASNAHEDAQESTTSLNRDQ